MIGIITSSLRHQQHPAGCSKTCPKSQQKWQMALPPTKSWPEKLLHHTIMFVWMLYANARQAKVHWRWIGCDIGIWDYHFTLASVSWLMVVTQKSGAPNLSKNGKRLRHIPNHDRKSFYILHHAIIFVWMLCKTNKSQFELEMNGLWYWDHHFFILASVSWLAV